MSELVEILAGLIAVIFIFAPHEFAHAFIAYKCGDGTAKMQGRMTLNPIKHLDPAGFILCAVAGFGWAKPVPIYPSNFRNYRKGLFCTAIAGVVTNYIIAFIAYPLYLVILNFVYYANIDFFYANEWLAVIVRVIYYAFFFIYAYGMGIVVFNLLPLYPLDGFRVVESLTREVNPVRRFLKNYGMYILIILVVESFLCGVIQRYTDIEIVKYFDILGYLQWFAVNIIGYPISALWNLIIDPQIWLEIVTAF
ncbi:MAG: site-2 protease family protein [Clostridia bacterium]|nr:site-2 protease family protein [Clostridia bacterium]